MAWKIKTKKSISWEDVFKDIVRGLPALVLTIVLVIAANVKSTIDLKNALSEARKTEACKVVSDSRAQWLKEFREQFSLFISSADSIQDVHIMFLNSLENNNVDRVVLNVNSNYSRVRQSMTAAYMSLLSMVRYEHELYRMMANRVVRIQEAIYLQRVLLVGLAKENISRDEVNKRFPYVRLDMRLIRNLSQIVALERHEIETLGGIIDRDDISISDDIFIPPPFYVLPSIDLAFLSVDQEYP